MISSCRDDLASRRVRAIARHWTGCRAPSSSTASNDTRPRWRISVSVSWSFAPRIFRPTDSRESNITAKSQSEQGIRMQRRTAEPREFRGEDLSASKFLRPGPRPFAFLISEWPGRAHREVKLMDVHPDAIRFLKNSRLCDESCRSVASEAANFVALAQDFVAVRHGWESSPRNFVATCHEIRARQSDGPPFRRLRRRAPVIPRLRLLRQVAPYLARVSECSKPLCKKTARQPWPSSRRSSRS